MPRDTQSKLLPTNFSPRRLEDSAWTGHLPYLAYLMGQLKPRIFVELGTHRGNSYFTACQRVDELDLATKCFAVDTWEGDSQAGFYDEAIFTEVALHNQRYQRFSSLLRMLFDDATAQFEEQSIDLLHIDGFHSYEAVAHDFAQWRSKLSDRSVVLFHDIAVRLPGFGVWQFWEEISQQFPTYSFQHSHGLGILIFGEKVDRTIFAPLQSEDPQQPSQQQVHFARLGEALVRKMTQTRRAARRRLRFKRRVASATEWLRARLQPPKPRAN